MILLIFLIIQVNIEFLSREYIFDNNKGLLRTVFLL